ncbi:enoyl-[acyl-carrier-protein] reductase FabL [Tumebacillus sp. ITR2]|uniref:Enoyl-[acyl-carrier-protein] reductase FabL n=1 Tax=Tumebacillus amylolyticus TaxID=2801339 RepID=A0ABS1J7U8_9BACL|nr:enoyl-[acyl-carrier-protein] reductase FabL [Tumebacillus amylolyticus]MBL0386134.1 enoyl-[acyl-carrier-protein] reductase FabL [Tumebacillus amylolyticus]
MSSLTGKIALVTGGSRGIGRSIALKLAEEGADVVINFFRNRKPAEETKAMIESLGRRCHIIKANVGDLDKHQLIFDEIQEVMGGLDILISNAASGVQLPAMEVEEKHWDWTLSINSKALLFLAQKAVPMMEARGGGSIVAISSLGSKFALKNYINVGTSKAALESIVRYLGVELAPKNIIVNAVSGAAVDTDALTHFPNREEMIQAAVDRTPAGRMITPEDLANSVLFLCSEQSRMIVGQTLVVDGGYSLIG